MFIVMLVYYGCCKVVVGGSYVVFSFNVIFYCFLKFEDICKLLIMVFILVGVLCGIVMLIIVDGMVMKLEFFGKIYINCLRVICFRILR